MKQCIICNESVPPGRVLSSHEKFGHVLCGDCYTRADEIGHIPAIVLNKGWDAYDENKSSGEPSEAAPSETDQSSEGVQTEEEDDDTTITLNAGGKSVTATPDEYREALATLEKRKQAASEQEDALALAADIADILAGDEDE